jgi:O-antigen ligase
MPGVPRAFSVALAGALVGWALFFGDDSASGIAWLGAFALAFAALVVAAAFDGRIERPRIGRLGAAAVACFAGLVLWQGASIVWSVQPDRSWDYVNRGLVYLAFLAVGCFLGAFASRRAVANGAAALLGLVLAYALLAKGIPALYPDYGRVARLRSPIGGWNQLALVADFALVLGLWRAAQRRWDGVLLVLGAIVTVLLAYSRGGIVIGLIVAASWLALDRRRFESLAGLAIGGAAAVAVFALSLALHGVTDDRQPHAVRVHDGRLFLLALVVAAIAAGLSGRAVLRLEPGSSARRRATVLLLVAIALGCVGGAVGVVLHGGPATSASPAGAHCAQSASRFACNSTDERIHWWKEAWQSFEDKPITGTGAGSFELSHRLRRADYTRPVTEPHNFALQTLGETGLVGFLLLVGAVGFGALAVRRQIRGDDVAVALGLCLLAYLVHIFIDVGYDFVAVSAPFFTLLGVLLAGSRTPVAHREPVWAFGTLLLAATAILSLAAPYVAQRKVDEAVRTGDPELAAQAHSWNPVSIDPLLIQAELEQSRGHKLKALQLYHEAVDTQPDNPDARVELGRFELYGMNDPCQAYRALNEAYALDRYNPDIAVKGGMLDVARAKARADGCL